MSQAELFASDMSDERIDELVLEAAKRAGFCVIMAGTEMRGHCGNYRQERSIIKLGMDECTPKQLRPMFKHFLTLTLTESSNA